MPKIIIASNRLPAEFRISENRIHAKPSVGGLATGLKSVHSSSDSLWIGWSGLTAEETAGFEKELESKAAHERCATVSLTASEVADYYFGFSNKSLWPLFHYFIEYTRYDQAQWEAYRQVNRKFADVILSHAGSGDIIWVHDYQLLLVPQLLREARPDLRIGFFLHIPFPAFEIIRTCPWRTELLDGILGADLVGFHTYDYVQHFLNSVKRINGGTVRFNEVILNGRTVMVDSFPMGIDYGKFADAARRHGTRHAGRKSDLIERLDDHRTKYPDSKLLLAIDRLDYTKGIPDRLRAFEVFLERYPQFTGKVRLVMLAVPSREDVPQYRKLKRETDELVGRINGKFATIDWTPVWYFYRSLPFGDLIALYTAADVAIITPLRDGMNLVAKEYVATRTERDGVLILSEMAGAASELSQALVINPNSAADVADALKHAIEMPPEEQRHRMLAMQRRVSRYTVDKWAQDFVEALKRESREPEGAACRRIDAAIENLLLSEYSNAAKRLVLLDYDGTLVGFRDNPDDAVPDDELYALLDRIQERPQTEVAIISGRTKTFLTRWFGHKPYTLISDHGVWMRRHRDWEKLEDPRTDWKESIRHVMESFVDRTPGAHIEEKAFSLAWHYRRTDEDLGIIRARELRILLAVLVPDLGLSVLDGNKVIEVKSSVVDKGRAVTRLIADGGFDFVFAAGDDHTDEKMFAELPEMAHSVKVGTADTTARYFTRDPFELRRLLLGFVIN
jgi:trehalose 6-phosphate synthase/phosphatase